MSLNAGRLRHRVTLQALASTLDTNGATVEDWTAVDALSAREFIAAQSVQSRVAARITIRARAVGASMRIKHGSTIYNIEGVLPDKDSGIEYLTLPVSTGVNEG